MEDVKKTRNAGSWALFIPGALLCLFAAWGLMRTPALCQYAVAGGDGAKAAAALEVWVAQDGLKTLYGASMYTASNGAPVSAEAGESAAATVFGVNAGFIEAHPQYLTQGRWFDAAETQYGVKAVVLDDLLAFRLFPGETALEKTVTLGETEYRVVGVVRGARAPGDVDDYTVYAPMRALDIAPVLIVGDCVATGAGEARALEEGARASLGEGGETLYLNKEVMRAWMILRLLIVVLGFFLFFAVLRWTNARLARSVSKLRSDLRGRYLRDMLPEILRDALTFLLLYAAIAGAFAGVLTLLIQIMFVFTEWIPDVFVEWSSLQARASYLVRHFARPVKLQTREMATLSFYALLLRWGLMLLLTGCAARLFFGTRRAR